jgi:hypothetical protein
VSLARIAAGMPVLTAGVAGGTAIASLVPVTSIAAIAIATSAAGASAVQMDVVTAPGKNAGPMTKAIAIGSGHRPPRAWKHRDRQRPLRNQHRSKPPVRQATRTTSRDPRGLTSPRARRMAIAKDAGNGQVVRVVVAGGVAAAEAVVAMRPVAIRVRPRARKNRGMKAESGRSKRAPLRLNPRRAAIPAASVLHSPLQPNHNAASSWLLLHRQNVRKNARANLRPVHPR